MKVLMVGLWNIFVSPVTLVKHIFLYIRHRRLASVAVDHYDKEWDVIEYKHSMKRLTENIPYLVAYICVQLLWQFVL